MPFKKSVAQEPDSAEEPKAKRPPTRPWEKNRDANKKWRVDYVRLAKKHPGFRPHWVRREKVELRKLQGWVVADPKDYGIDPVGLGDTQSVGNYVQRNELILMELPEEMALARAEYLEEQSKAAQRAARAESTRELGEVNRQLAEMGKEPIKLIDETEGIR